MKLRVVELLLVSTLPAMVLAAEGLPDLSLVLATIFAGTLAAGSANAFNMVIESDLDKLMARTAKRPVVTGQISKKNASIFAIFLSPKMSKKIIKKRSKSFLPWSGQLITIL